MLVPRRRRGVTTLAVTGLVVAGATGPAAGAADLPTGTFKVGSVENGSCAQVACDGYVRVTSCSSALGQRFISDLLTKQIRPVSSPADTYTISSYGFPGSGWSTGSGDLLNYEFLIPPPGSAFQWSFTLL